MFPYVLSTCPEYFTLRTTPLSFYLAFSVWCEAFSANFGEVVIPATLSGLTNTASGPKLLCSVPVPVPVPISLPIPVPLPVPVQVPVPISLPIPVPVPVQGASISLGSFRSRQHQLQGTVTILSERVIEVTVRQLHSF